MLILASLHNLSDAQMEFYTRDRLSVYGTRLMTKPLYLGLKMTILIGAHTSPKHQITHSF